MNQVIGSVDAIKLDWEQITEMFKIEQLKAWQKEIKNKGENYEHTISK